MDLSVLSEVSKPAHFLNGTGPHVRENLRKEQEHVG